MLSKNIKKGTILVAKPTLINDIFQRSVAIIINHAESGSIGFIINRSTNLPINVFVSELDSNYIVYEGGPVDKENIYYIHKRPDLISNSEKIMGNIYWSGSYDDVKKAINSKQIKSDEIKFLIGYCGWSPQQILNEINNNSWEILDLNFNIFEYWNFDLWKILMKQLGGENLLWVNTPADPSMN